METLNDREREALGLPKENRTETPVQEVKRGRGRPSNEELAARKKAIEQVEQVSAAEKARQEMLASFGTEQDDVFVEPKKISEVNLDELLAGLTIDVSNFEIVEKNPLELFEEKSIVINGRSTFEVVCNQSAYVAHMESLKYSDMAALENSTSSYYAGRQRLFKTVYEKINSTSVGKVDFQTFLKMTSLYDLASLIYGIYCQTFKTEADFTVTCPHCKKSMSIKVPNKNLMLIKDEETFANIQEILGSVSTPEEAMKNAVINLSEQIVLPNSKMIFKLKIPSLYKYLEIVGSVAPDKFEEAKDILGVLVFVENVYKLDITKLVKEKKVAYYEVKDRGEIAQAIANMEVEDSKVLQEAIAKKTEKYSIDYAIKKFNCLECKKEMGPIPIDIEELTFFRLEQM